MLRERLAGSFARSIALSGLVASLLLQGSGSEAFAEQEVDLRLRMDFISGSEYHPPGGDVKVALEATHNDGRTSGGIVELYLPKSFTNVRFYSYGGYGYCDVLPATLDGAPAWKAACIKNVIDPNGSNGKGEDTVGVLATAPHVAGQYRIVGVITPVNATEVDDADNRRQLDVKVAASSRTSIPRNVLTRPIQPPPGTSGR